MNKQDLTQYSDDELSLQVFNDESLYNLRRYPAALDEAILNLFEYTNAQYQVLQTDLEDDRTEVI